jgi:hypothetical protein
MKDILETNNRARRKRDRLESKKLRNLDWVSDESEKWNPSLIE